MAPRPSCRKARRHPPSLSFHGRTKTRPSTTTTQTPVKRCSVPARTPTILLSEIFASTVFEKPLGGRGVAVLTIGGAPNIRKEELRHQAVCQFVDVVLDIGVATVAVVLRLSGRYEFRRVAGVVGVEAVRRLPGVGDAVAVG